MTFLLKICLFIALWITVSQQDTMTIQAQIRDFWPCTRWSDCGQSGLSTPRQCERCHPDFERAIGSEKNIVQNFIGASGGIRVPVFNATRSRNTVANATTFDMWYRDVPGVNLRFVQNLTLTNSPSNPSVFSYQDENFYPITNQGFGNFLNNLNYHFTLEIHESFTFRGGERFDYTGDDDLWVFINNRLVIDLGGVHAPESASVQLNNLGLTVGQTYRIDIFFAERHTVMSNFKMFTSLALFCAWRDHCDICQGTGQSCCTCNDNNLCTKDSCEVFNGTCIHEPIECKAPSGSCLNATCTPQGGCVMTPLNCDDGNACTNNTCIPGVGDGCPNPVNIICNDNNACTVDSCNPATGCVFNYACDDNNACTNDTCNPATGCSNTQISCEDNNRCTINTCNPATGCQTEDVICNDNNVCTNDRCDPTVGCIYDPITCTDNNLCTEDMCDPQEGCQFPDIICNDTNVCTRDTCDPGSGCRFTPITCGNITDSCSRSFCVQGTGCVVIDLGDACDRCDNVTCPESDACNPYSCFNGTCTQEPITCDDGNLCTDDQCIPHENGTYTCQNTPKPCVGTGCNPRSCNTQNGQCVEQIITCNDNNPCTDDSCESFNATSHICRNVQNCEPPNGCFNANCIRANGTCIITPKNCDDGNACSTDSCNPDTGACVHIFKQCDTSFCNPLSCNPITGNCEGTPRVCSDGSACTADSCSNSTSSCINEPISCDDFNNCTIDSCSSLSGCLYANRTCNDFDACTIDTCDPEIGCVFTPIDPNSFGGPDRDDCLVYFCDPVVGVRDHPLECRPADRCKCERGRGCVCSGGGLLGDISTEQAALGLGAIVAIILGAAAFVIFVGVGSKKGYDYFKQKDLMTGTVMSSDLYQPSMSNLENPLYENTKDEL